MRRIVYISKAEKDFSLVDLQELASKAAEKNRRLGITGYLSFSNGRVLQFLEGEDGDVTALLDEIRDDPRHEIVYEIHWEHAIHRLFDTWAMRLITTKQLDDFIEQHLLFIKMNLPHKRRCEEFVWRSVARIAGMQSQLALS